MKAVSENDKTDEFLEQKLVAAEVLDSAAMSRAKALAKKEQIPLDRATLKLGLLEEAKFTHPMQQFILRMVFAPLYAGARRNTYFVFSGNQNCVNAFWNLVQGLRQLDPTFPKWRAG